MTRRHSIRKIVSQLQENAALDLIPRKTPMVTLLTFIEAYEELRHAAPKGDLHIHLSIEEKDEQPADKRVFRTGAGPEAGK